MPRKKVQAVVVASQEPQQVDSAAPSTTPTDSPGKLRPRSYKATLTLSEKGVTLGVRDGHDWVVSFPGDPGKEVKDKLSSAGFAYRDRKWRVFTNAGNRPAVESLVKELKNKLGEEIAVNEYVARQVVLAFDSPPADEMIARLKETGFHYRPDRTWNADYTPENQKLAYDLIQSLPTLERQSGRGG